MFRCLRGREPVCRWGEKLVSCLMSACYDRLVKKCGKRRQLRLPKGSVCGFHCLPGKEPAYHLDKGTVHH